MSDVIRIEPWMDFTPLPNQTVCDRRLSLRTLGLLLVMASRPPDWDFSVRGLAAYCELSRDTIRKSLMELEAAGYLTRRQLHGDKGTFSGNEYIVRVFSSADEDAEGGDLQPEDASAGEVGTPLPEKSSTVAPLPKKPSPVFSPQSNNIPNSNTPHNPPTKGTRRTRRKGPRDAPDWEPARFEGLWRFYPAKGKRNKQRAMNAWDKLRPSKAVIDAMAVALKKLAASEEWQKGIGIPHVATFLNNLDDYLGNAAELDAPDAEVGTEAVEGRPLKTWA